MKQRLYELHHMDEHAQHPHQSAAGHTGNQLGSLATQDESSQIKEHAHHRQQDKHIDLEMEAWGEEGGVCGDGGGRRGGTNDKEQNSFRKLECSAVSTQTEMGW